MKSNLESLSKLERRLNIAVPTQSVKEAFDRAYRSIQKHATIKGFRKGKAPLQTIKTMYSDRVKQDVIQDLVQKHYVEALTEHQLNPVSFPDINFNDIEDSGEFNFTAQFEVRPEVELKNYKGLPVKKEKVVIDDARIEQSLERIRESHAEMRPMLEERPVTKGDVAVIDFEGTLESGPLENGKGTDHQLEIGSNSFIAGFEEGIEGMRIGETRTVDLKFPEEYHVKEIAGQPVSFKVTLKDIKRRVLPELTDDFVKKLGALESVDALKAEVRRDLESSETRRAQDGLKQRLLQELVSQNPVDVPKALLEEQRQALVRDFQQRLTGQGFTEKDFEQYQEKWNEDFDQTAMSMIQTSFLLDKIAQTEGLEVTEEDVENKLKTYSEQMNLDVEMVRGFYSDKKRANQFQYQLLEEKVVDFLLQNAKIEEVEAGSIQDEE